MPRLLLVSLLFLCGFMAQAQNPLIQIKTSEKSGAPVFGTTLKITNRADSARVFYGTTDTLGILKINLPGNAQYTISASSVGFKTQTKGLNVTDKNLSVPFILEEDNLLLQAVTVTARKPFMKQEDDKTIVDPEPIASTSTSALEILEKTPGLFVDQEGNVYLSNSSPASIYINGREQKMSAADIASILKSLPPGSIDRIEIMRTPSAKYDASGGSGVVNIILKKGVKIGRTGSLNAGMSQGRYGNQFVGVNLNNNEGRRNSFLNLNYSRRNSFEEVITNRSFSTDNLISQKAWTTFPGQSFYAGLGLNYELSKKWDINYDGRFNLNAGESNASNTSIITKLNNPSPVSENLNKVGNNTDAYGITQGFSTKYKIDSLGSEITTDVSYNYFLNKGNQDYETIFKIPAATGLAGNGNWDNGRNLFTAQTDLRYKLPKKILIEAGLKTSIQRFNSETKYNKLNGDVEEPDLFRTNTFNYRENINAAYVQASKTFGEFILKVGTRLENTNMYGHQTVPADTSFKLRRTDLFPYVYFSRKLGKIASYEMRAYLVARRTITRPVYEYLNPFPRFIDQYLYESGNPGLRPQFTQNYEMNISFEDRPIFALGRNYTQDIFTSVIYQNPQNPSVAFRTYDNLGKNQETYFRLLGAVPPGKKYFFVIGSQFNLNDYNGLYENSPLKFKRGSWSFFTFQQFKIDKLSTISLNGFFRMKGQLQFYELSNFGNLNLSVNRQFLSKKLMITASMNDIFYTNKNDFTINQGSISAVGSRRADTRRFTLNLRYNFGLKKKEESNNMFNIEGI